MPSFCRLLRPLIFVLLGMVAVSARAAEPIEFNRDIRPILTDQCISCHGPDSHSRKADLRLDQRESAIEAGAIVPGKPDESEFVRRITSLDPDEIMPPPDSHKKLSDEQRKLLMAWIEGGAEYQAHWSFIAPEKSPPPEVKQTAWVRNPIDQFILAKLEKKGLQPNSEADIRTLVRRVCLDLTGLPPTAEEVESVVADPNPDRYERFVDSLLTRPTWGEHRARYWMDYARYGDTHGIHFDNYREMYSYRDWVIEAFNRNLPFDQFTIQQLAGDLLPNATLEQQIASGFNRCNITTNEGGIIDEEYAVLYARDRVETTSAVWLGLTTGCAVCHDHKFDPITQREFYQLAAFFNNTTQKVRDGNVKDTPPIIPVPLPEDEDRYFKLVGDEKALQTRMSDHRKKSQKTFDKWLANGEQIRTALRLEAAKLPKPVLHIPLLDDSDRTVAAVVDGRLEIMPLDKAVAREAGSVGDKAWMLGETRPFVVAAEKKWDVLKPFSTTFWIKPTGDRNTGGILGSADESGNNRGWEISLNNNKIVVQINGAGKELIRLTSEKGLASKQWQHVSLTYDGQGKAAGVRLYLNGEVWRTKTATDTLKSGESIAVGIRLGGKPKGNVPEKLWLQDVRYFSEALTAETVVATKEHARVVRLVGREKRNETETVEVADWYYKNLDGDYGAWFAQSHELRREIEAVEKRGTIAHVMAEKPEMPVAFVLNRGEYDQRRDEVKPDTPSVLPPMPDNIPRNRLGMAQWLVMPEHPLTARVTVNRFWQEIFGQGLVGSTGDFGLSGMQPVNQELLDYLAVTFRENDWNVKELFRMIVTSATYRQSPTADQNKLTIDPTNTLLARGPRFRMDAEMIRDYALYVSGLMSRKLGGKSVRPYQPPGVWEAVAMPNSDTQKYVEDSGEALYRRSLYTFWKRAAPPASMEIFNAPSREVCTVKRERTNTPLQALVTLNDPQFVEAARQLSERAMREKDSSNAARIQWLATAVLGRKLHHEEAAIVESGRAKLEAFYTAQPIEAENLLSVGKSPRDKGLDPTQHAVWTMVAHQLLNLDEALCK